MGPFQLEIFYDYHVKKLQPKLPNIPLFGNLCFCEYHRSAWDNNCNFPTERCVLEPQRSIKNISFCKDKRIWPSFTLNDQFLKCVDLPRVQLHWDSSPAPGERKGSFPPRTPTAASSNLHGHELRLQDPTQWYFCSVLRDILAQESLFSYLPSSPLNLGRISANS